MKIVLASDSFKGCLTSAQVAQALKTGLMASYPQADCQPMVASDGGEGFLDAMSQKGGVVVEDMTAHNAVMQVVKARIGFVDDYAIIESAQALGLHLVQPTKRNIMRATSFGLGEMMAYALSRGSRRLIIGLGGSATNDAGVGMLQALGARVLNANGHVVRQTGNPLLSIAALDISQVSAIISDVEITLACDVKNPLYGPTGATMTFGQQKGASAFQQPILEQAVVQYARIVEDLCGKDYSQEVGVGAAGGIAFSAVALLNAQIRSGAQTWMDCIGFNKIISDADYVITGEGKSDRQTLMGKLPYRILQQCKKQNVKCGLISGQVENKEQFLGAGFEFVEPVSHAELPLRQSLIPSVATQNIIKTASALQL